VPNRRIDSASPAVVDSHQVPHPAHRRFAGEPTAVFGIEVVEVAGIEHGGAGFGAFASGPALVYSVPDD
jgi:hypothetical protein